VNAAAQYRQLLSLGREGFLASAAAAALVHYAPGQAIAAGNETGARTLTLEDEETLDESAALARPAVRDRAEPPGLELFPLAKKPGASFPDRITIGRTSNNDVVIVDTSVSRLHAYVRRVGDAWSIADAGSKNGSWLRGEKLEARREKPLMSRAIVRFGEIDLTFYVAADLFAALGGPA
jgi:hypothetical protein